MIVPSGFNDSRTGKPTATLRTSMFEISVCFWGDVVSMFVKTLIETANVNGER